MRQHMPKKYWRNLPESSLIPTLIADAGSRTLAMLDNPPTAARVARATPQIGSSTLPQDESLASIRSQALQCRDCPLWQNATQTVFGEGSPTASIVFVGEQPGDQEDRAGQPFVGPSGRLLDSVLERAGLDRAGAYVTNAVKHFKWVPDGTGKRRIHKTPSSSEVRACHPWLDEEIAVVKPRVIVALGATAAKALFGPAIRVTAQHGKVIRTDLAEAGFATVHPSSILRAPSDVRAEAEAQFVADLEKVAKWLNK
jgi:DNA polymerase